MCVSSRSPLDNLRYTLMPSLVLGTAAAAIIMRHTRSSMIAVLKQDFVRTARAKGLSERIVVARHALRNGLIPVVTTRHAAPRRSSCRAPC